MRRFYAPINIVDFYDKLLNEKFTTLIIFSIVMYATVIFLRCERV